MCEAGTSIGLNNRNSGYVATFASATTFGPSVRRKRVNRGLRQMRVSTSVPVRAAALR